MRLREGMIRDYLNYVASMTFVDTEDVTEDMSVFDDAIYSMSVTAQDEGHLEDLRLALDSLISEPDGRIGAFAGAGHPFSDPELIEIFMYIYETIWPSERISRAGEALPIEIVDVSQEEWDAEFAD